jgi:ABC-type spermidine/putrescine transport system permease subunit II
MMRRFNTPALIATPVFVVLVAPSLIVIPMAFTGSTFLEFPPRSLSLRWFTAYFADERWLDATWRSLRVALAVTIIATSIGSMAALALARTQGAWSKTAKLLIVSPIMLPVIIYAIAVYALCSRLHLIGSDAALILAHSVLAIPFVFLSVGASLARYDDTLDRAAASSGANAWRTFWLVRYPLIRPGMLAGALFAFITSFDEVVVALFVGGLDATLPMQMFNEMRWNLSPVVAAIAVMLIALTSVALWVAARSRSSD